MVPDRPLEDAVTETKLTAQELAQAMLDKYGFFVVLNFANFDLPHVVNVATEDALVEGSVSNYVLLERATSQDYAEQAALVGYAGPPTPGAYMYRAVAE
jgi:hypothetical protein